MAPNVLNQRLILLMGLGVSMQNKKPPLAGGEKENDKMELILKGAPGELFVFGTAQKAPAEEPSCTPSAPKNQSEQHKDMPSDGFR